jgi:hypothetical protein
VPESTSDGYYEEVRGSRDNTRREPISARNAHSIGAGLKGFGTAAAARHALYLLLAVLFDSEEDKARGHAQGTAVGRLLSVGAVSGGGIETVACRRYPYLVHSFSLSSCGPGSGGCYLAGPFLCLHH